MNKLFVVIIARIFFAFSGQEYVFSCLGTDVLDNAFKGYNACVFAYGQTGTALCYVFMSFISNALSNVHNQIS